MRYQSGVWAAAVCIWASATPACSDSAPGKPDALAGDATADTVTLCTAKSPVGQICDDGNPCTTGDACASSKCIGTLKSCEDKLSCTQDNCAMTGQCEHVVLLGWCTIGGACFADGSPKPGDACRRCSSKQSAVDFSIAATACEDGNACTTAEACDLAGACTGTLISCDDKNPCTQDACEAKAGCTHKVTSGPCSDSNPCSVGDLCDGSTCKAGTGTLGCEDNNACTDDSCKGGKGCVHTATKAPCNDGEACTTPDTCTGGACVGIKTSMCPKCNNLFGGTSGKLTQFQIGGSGAPGDGIDVDGDPTTCAPLANCSGGIDNAAAVLSGFINKVLISGVTTGSLTFVAEFAGYAGEGVPFTLNLYYAEMLNESQLAGCKPQADVCKWLIGQSALTGQCKPKFSFADAMVKNGKLTAGTKNTLFAMDADLIGAKNATLYVKGARIQGEVTFAPGTQQIAGMQGVLGGAVPQSAVLDMLGALKDGAFAESGLTKDQVIQLVTQLLETDIDVDGDDIKESASIGIRFSAVGAILVGALP